MAWRAAVEAVTDVLWPPSCAACDAVLPAPGAFCERCAQEVLELSAVHCPRCAEPGDGVCARCETQPPPWEKAFAPFEHEGSLARAIHRFKYEDRADLARPLGVLMAATAKMELRSMPGVLLPLPLHEARYRTRGFDQAALLAKEVATATGRPLQLDWLNRTRDTVRQVGLSEEAREANVHGAFVASPAVKGADVVLIDDVLTTGASAREAVRVLTSAGARRVFVLTLARARRENATR